MNSGILLGAAVVWPGVLLLACALPGLRKHLGDWLWCGPVPALAAGIFGTEGSAVLILNGPCQISLALDQPGRTLLVAASLLWLAAGIYTPFFFRANPVRGGFVASWLCTMIGSLGIFLASDLMGFLVFYAMVSLPAYAFVVQDGTVFAKKAGAIYMGFALLGENLLLMAFVLLAGLHPLGNMQISEVVNALQTSPNQPLILILLIFGFGMKMALLPMHFWMPPAYCAAPVPAAAVMSGAAVKAGVIGLLRFLPFETALPACGHLLVGVGLAGAFFGVAVGLTQNNPKSVLAYSSISQMGFLAALLGMGLTNGDSSVVAIAAFYAAHHVLVKGALFLAVGVVAESGSKNLSLVRWPALIIGLGLAGLPLTGGALAKLASKQPMGYGVVAFLASLSAAGTALLMLHFLQKTMASHHSNPQKSAPSGMLLPWLGTAALCIILPWLLYPWSGLDSSPQALAPATLWKTLWPILLGILLFLCLKSWRLPQIPCGDILRFGGLAKPIASAMAAMLAALDGLLKMWAPACIALLVLVIFLTSAMLHLSN